MEAIGPKRSSPSADPADLVCKVMVLNSHSRKSGEFRQCLLPCGEVGLQGTKNLCRPQSYGNHYGYQRHLLEVSKPWQYNQPHWKEEGFAPLSCPGSGCDEE